MWDLQSKRVDDITVGPLVVPFPEVLAKIVDIVAVIPNDDDRPEVRSDSVVEELRDPPSSLVTHKIHATRQYKKL